MVWSCQQGKHEETVRVVYGLINEVVTDIPAELVTTLFAKVAQQPAEEYSEMYIEFLKEFTLRALGADEAASYSKARSSKTNPEGQELDGEQSRPDIQKRVFSDLKAALEEPDKNGLGEGVKLYGLPILWDIVQDSFHTGAEVKSGDILRVALEAF